MNNFGSVPILTRSKIVAFLLTLVGFSKDNAIKNVITKQAKIKKKILETPIKDRIYPTTKADTPKPKEPHIRI